MKLSRKGFLKTVAAGGAYLALAGVAGVSFLTGCAGATIAAAVVTAFNQVLSLLQSSGIVTNSGLINDAQLALKAFSDAFDAYEKAKSQGTLQALGQAAEKALADVQAFLAATDLGGILAQAVATLVQIILATLISFLPAPAPTSLRLKGAREVTVTPAAAVWKTDPKAARVKFVADFDAACVAVGHADLKIK